MKTFLMAFLGLSLSALILASCFSFLFYDFSWYVKLFMLGSTIIVSSYAYRKTITAK